jgi:hypothetical protein
VQFLPFPRNLDPRALQCPLTELAHRVRLAAGNDVILRGILLKHQPHHLDIIARKTPVAFRAEIAKVQAVLQAVTDAADRARDLARTSVSCSAAIRG